METNLELKDIDYNQLKEADMVVDDENNLVDTEIQELDCLIVDIDEEENLVATTVPQTPRPSLYLHSETLRGSVYWKPNVESTYLPIEGKVHNTIEKCVDFYTVYAKLKGFEVKKSAQKKTRSGLVKSKYVMCNREGVPKDININTLDPENSDKQVRNTRHRITSCKARIKVDLHYVSENYKITKSVSKHNHQMILKHYKHLTKKQRKMTQAEKLFVVKASTMKLANNDCNGSRCSNELAIEEVLTESKHRLFMWHIMQKILAKICTEIYDETDFKERFNKIVWNMFMEPMKFEEKWSKLIEDFGLKNHKWMNHKWMTKMFNLREMWLPAYFIDSPLFGLMRTTSRSESENTFFKSFTNHGSTLVNFMMCFESAMERQRTIFLLVQKEIIEAMWACQILECKTEEGCEIVKVRDKRASAYRTLNTEKEKDVVQQNEYVAEYKLKTIKQEVQVQVPKPPSRETGDVIEDIYAVEKPQQNDVNNPQRARNKGDRRGERRKSGREIALKAKTKQIQKCLCYGEKINKHTKSTCSSNPKYVAKLARLVAAAAEQRTTTAAATEQATTTTTTGEQGATTAAATDEATTTAIVSEEATNAS
uniref:Protein FAR1-related sequence 5-like n=1 Tax=Tanacetum cinerariifolium TaxID=118510 RepID=A0A6L2N1Z9_TANCI|nr:protein FAR1-related sequence 5-like [Tanacetum cinerariifolium]